MSLRALGRSLAGYALLLVIACIAMRQYARVRTLEAGERRVVVSGWSGGARVRRTVTEPGARPAPSAAAAAPLATGAQEPAITTVEETTIAEGPLSLAPWSFPFALVPGVDGIVAVLDGKTAFLTVDDLIAAQAYDRAGTIFDPSLGVGTHRGTVLHLLATDLGVSPAEVATRGSFRRVRFERNVVGAPPPRRITASTLDPADVRIAVRSAAAFVARGVDDDGRYRYLVDPISNNVLPGYNWPRHAGTTYFLAQAAALLDDPGIRFACLRAAARLRDDLMKDCGAHKCISADTEADVGSSALALMAFVEIVRSGADASYLPAVKQLAGFLRAQQRPDGELMHLYDRSASRPVDVQLMYFTGEASLALARAHRVTGDPEDLRAASRALSRLSGRGWSFFGSRYYFSEEHWTCQAMADLWARAPDPEALGFCLRWHVYQRRLQRVDGDSPFDADGAFGFGPLVTPRVTPASSRGEAAAAALGVLKSDVSAGGANAAEHDATVAALDDELRRAIAFVMRAQLRPGSRHLFARPDEVHGGVPASAVDLQLRIDYAQHAGSMMVRWLELSAPP